MKRAGPGVRQTTINMKEDRESSRREKERLNEGCLELYSTCAIKRGPLSARTDVMRKRQVHIFSEENIFVQLFPFFVLSSTF